MRTWEGSGIMTYKSAFTMRLVLDELKPGSF